MRSRPVQRARSPRALGGGYIRSRTGVGFAGVECPPLFGRNTAAGCVRPSLPRGALGDTPVLGVNPPFNDYVEAWRALVSQYAAPDLPVDFLLAWISIESNGNPCSWTSLSEAGIFQLMSPDNLTAGQTTLAQQHPVPPCANGKQTTATFSSLTPQQATDQVVGGLTYVRYCVTQATTYLNANGYSWDPSSTDFWCAVKMVHVAPAALQSMLQQGVANNGGVAPDTWADLMPLISGVPASWTANAQAVGQFGGSPSASSILADLGLAGIAALLIIGGGLWYLSTAESA